MPDFPPHNPPDYLSPFTGDGVNFEETTGPGLDIRPIPLSAGVLQDGIPWTYDHVFSPFCRLYFARHGDLYIRTENKTYQVPANGFLLIPAEFTFHCGTDGSAEHLWIHFRVQPPWLEGFKRPVVNPGDSTSRELAGQLWKLLARSSFPNPGIHLVKSLLHLLFRGLKLSATSPIPPQLQSAFHIVNEHLYSPLSVKELAQKVGYSPEHLSHLFRKHLKQSPSDFIRKARIHEAARRLAYTDDTIEAIADDLCFANRHHLSRVFKTVINEPPAAFRNRIRNRGQ
ncbi:MAG: helix-turn-helix domain-containing protein [Puniceicoccaceae bacterium]